MDRLPPTEKGIVLVNDWIGNISETGHVAEMDIMLLRSVLAEYGANFKISEEAKNSLGKSTNAGRRLGMDEVWGHEKVGKYRIWLKKWVEDYEVETGKPLPVIVDGTVNDTPTKTSGGLKFFTDLTSYAAGIMSFEDYKSTTEKRAEKGRLWRDGEATEPGLSSFPPKFPSEAWEFIKTLKKLL